MIKKTHHLIKQKKLYRLFGLLLLIIYSTACGYFYLYQEQLLFHPEEVPETHPEELKPYEITLQNDGINLHGWYIHGRKKKPLLVYFGGNSEIISKTILKYKKHFKGKYDILAFEYRGFGASEGTPSESKLIQDGTALVSRWIEKHHYKTDNIVLIGRSLGTAIAVQVALATEPRGIILLTPFDSINAVAEYTYPYIPIRYLNYNPFLSDKYAPDLTSLGLLIIAEKDTITPPAHGLRLAQLMPTLPKIVTVDNAEHHSIYSHSETWENIEIFLKEILSDS